MNHVYFGTKKREAELVRTTINKQQLADGLGDISLKLAAMKEVVKITDSELVEPDRTKCSSCAFIQHCPTKTTGASIFMGSLTDRFRKPAVAAPVASPGIPVPPPSPATSPQTPTMGDPDPTPVIMATPTAPAAPKKTIPIVDVDSVLPPDAPKSNPALAANPVPGFSPIPAPLTSPAPVTAAPIAPAPTPEKKRGRPAGSKNASVGGASEPVMAIVEEEFEVVEISLTHGATVSARPTDPKCYEFIRADFRVKAHVRKGVDVNKVREEISKLVQEGLVAELAKYTP
jgi:hypothetical protein